MRLWRWLVALCWLAAAPAWAVASPSGIVSIRTWEAPAGSDTFPQALAALRRQPADAAPRGELPEFQVKAATPTWYAFELQPVGRPSVLEFTHPSLRTVELYSPDHSPTDPVARAGRVVPVEDRLHQRFPGALPIQASKDPQVVYVRVHSVGAARGQVQLLARTQWETLSRLLLAGMTLGFGVSALAALYALARAAWHRSPAYLVYALLTLAMIATGLLVTGLGEGTAWSRFSATRGPAAVLMACTAAGLGLLLAERGFALEISAPRFGGVLRVLGLALPAGGALAVLFLPPGWQQGTALAAGGVALAMAAASAWMSWRTNNPVAAWLLVGNLPVGLGVAAVTLALAGAVPYSEWSMLVPAVAGMLHIPFSLHGLKLLEARRADVRRSQRLLVAEAGPDGESREEVARRLEVPPATPGTPRAGATLMLLRFEGLAPGASGAALVDNAAVERYLHAMMTAGLRPGARVGRWSHHELLLRDLHNKGENELDGLVTALFAQSQRSQRYGIPQSVPNLRIAVVRVKSIEVPVRGLARQLARALDNPLEREVRRVELDPWVD